MIDLFTAQHELVRDAVFLRVSGKVAEITGLTIRAEGLAATVGAMCRIDRSQGLPIDAQVVGISAERAVLMPLQEPLGVAAGDRVTTSASGQTVAVGRQMLGCILDGMGRPIGGRMDFAVENHYPVFAAPPPPLTRAAIDEVLPTGIRSIDAMHTVGGGQRLGIFAGTGVGKSVLLGMMARYTAADVIVVALIGERGREVGDFLRKDLGPEGFARCVMVVSTSDESPVMRVRAGFTATAVAEYFRDLGKNVLLLMDSTTRIAMAQRQIGLAAGEPPTTKGYPPSVFSLLPRLLERSGRTAMGSITGLYTVLVEGDDLTDPISDAIRGILDGHVVLSRELADRGHYPSVAVLGSISRLMPDLVTEEHREAAQSVRQVLATYNDLADLISVGAYVPGANTENDLAVAMKPRVDGFLRQAMSERADWPETVEGLRAVRDEIRRAREKLTTAAPARRAALEKP